MKRKFGTQERAWNIIKRHKEEANTLQQQQYSKPEERISVPLLFDVEISSVQTIDTKTSNETPIYSLNNGWYEYRIKDVSVKSDTKMSWSELANSIMEIESAKRDIKRELELFGKQDLLPLPTLRQDIPGLAEREMLRVLEQNSPLWEDLRSFFVGSSEYASLLNMNPWSLVHHFMRFKQGVFGRNKDPKLPFEIGHMFEDSAGKAFEVVARCCWGLDDFHLDDVGVLASKRRGRWSSIDRKGRGKSVLPWSLIESFDSTWECKWKLTEEDRKRGGVAASRSLVEIKTRVYPWKILSPKEVLRPEDQYTVQTQDQMLVSQEQEDWPEFANVDHAFIAKLQPAFGKHHDMPGDLHTTLEEDQVWWLHIWLTRYSPEFFEKAIPREKYFMEHYHKASEEEFSFPPWLPEPEVPSCIYLGSYGLEGVEETVTVDLNHKETPGRILEPPSNFKIIDKYADGLYFIQECIEEIKKEE